MARIESVDLEKADDYAKKVFEAQLKKWGTRLAPYLLYARRSTIFRAVRGMWIGIEASGLIDGKLQALVNRRVASLNGCPF